MTSSQVVFANFRVIWKTCSGGILTCRSARVYHIFFFFQDEAFTYPTVIC